MTGVAQERLADGRDAAAPARFEGRAMGSPLRLTLAGRAFAPDPATDGRAPRSAALPWSAA